MSYNIAIAYRIYPGVSKTPILRPDSKYALSEVAIASLKDSLQGVKAKVWAILDGCPPEYEKLFTQHFSPEDLTIVHTNRIGNGATFNLQLQTLSSQNDSDIVYFAEDDYFYRPGQFRMMLDFMAANPDVDFLSPYDHRDYYTLDLHKRKEYIRTTEYCHWRTAATTCLTFIARKKSLVETLPIFYTFAKKNFDASIWLALTKSAIVYNPLKILSAMLSNRLMFSIYAKAWVYTPLQLLFGTKRSLWCPIPAAATHLENDGVAPCIDWQAEFKRYPSATP